jgi:hypothetical protein
MNGFVAMLQLRPILSHQTRRLPKRSINKTEFHSLRKRQIIAISEPNPGLANCFSRVIDGHPRQAWRIQP